MLVFRIIQIDPCRVLLEIDGKALKLLRFMTDKRLSAAPDHAVYQRPSRAFPKKSGAPGLSDRGLKPVDFVNERDYSRDAEPGGLEACPAEVHPHPAPG